MSQRYLTLSEMVRIQSKLNEHTVTDWQKVLNANDFKTAMFDEFAELLNSAPFKWWKKSDNNIDIWNLKIEAVDILHFALSIYIINNTVNNSADLVLGLYNTDNAYMINNGRIDRNVFINRACNTLTSDNPIVLDELFDSLGMLAEEVSAIYTAKSELNHIRQSEGYKTGKYTKVVDGVEDNVRLQAVVEDFLSDKDMMLTDLRDMVRGEFFIGADEDFDFEFIDDEQTKTKEEEETINS